jgi:5,10-methylenetetrahydromethanopterin reductase
MILEAEFSPGMPVAACEQLAALIEEAGFDRLGISDVVHWPDTYVVQAACARVTHAIEIGPMVTNPYLRHPAVTAAAVATVDEVSGGRAFLGFGVGAGLEAAGVDPSRPVTTLRAATNQVRALLDGKRVGARTTSFGLHEAQLRLPPATGRGVPIAIGTRSPSVARLAGELADRALVGARYLSPNFAAQYRSWVAQGAQQAGRNPTSVEIAPRLTLCCSTDRDAAYATQRRDAAEFLVTLRPDDLAVEPERLAAIEAALRRAKGWYFDPEAYHPPELDDLVDDGLVEAFSICGGADDLVPQFARVAAMGFSSVSLKLAPVRMPGWSMLDGLRETVRTAAKAIPAIKALEPTPDAG